MSVLARPCAAAAGGFTGDTSLLDFLGSKEQGGLVLMLLAALATGRLYERVEMDGQPVMHDTDGGLRLELLEIKAKSSGGRAKKRPQGCGIACSERQGCALNALNC